MDPVKENNECVHFWVIDTPHGPTSAGRCKYCGMTKEFLNVWTDSFNEHQVAPPAEERAEQEKTYA
jgi:hypothetical protein